MLLFSKLRGKLQSWSKVVGTLHLRTSGAQCKSVQPMGVSYFLGLVNYRETRSRDRESNAFCIGKS